MMIEMRAATGTAGSQVPRLGGATVAAGGALAAAAASICCAGPAVGPLLVSLLGAGGAVAFEGLRPYSPYIVAASGIILGWTIASSRRARQCAPDERGRIARSFTRGILWASAALWLAAAVGVAYGFAVNGR